jgi:hypothetical protein
MYRQAVATGMLSTRAALTSNTPQRTISNNGLEGAKGCEGGDVGLHVTHRNEESRPSHSPTSSKHKSVELQRVQNVCQDCRMCARE